MLRNPVLSTNLASVGYDYRSATLEVEFHSGKTYQYFGVPTRIWEGFVRVARSGASMGSFFNEQIKPNFQFSRVE